MREQLELVRAPLALLGAPTRIPRVAADARRAVESVVSSLGSPAPSAPSLNPALSPLRHLARIDRPMDDVDRSQALGTTVDAVRPGRLLERRAALPRVDRAGPTRGQGDDAGRPAQLAGGGRTSATGSRSCSSTCRPTIPTPVRQLRALHADTSARKAADEAHAAESVLSVLGYAPHLIQRALTRLVASPTAPSTSSSRTRRAHGCGCAVRAARGLSVVPLAEHHALAIGVTWPPAVLLRPAARKMFPESEALAGWIDSGFDDSASCRRPVEVARRARRDLADRTRDHNALNTCVPS